ncbi:MAG: DUF1501 domain-containing protein [Planctomycetota bacterium]
MRGLDLQQQMLQSVTRRHFLGGAGLGVGAMALSNLLGSDGLASTGESAGPHASYRVPARAKSIIYLHMAGSPSQIDLFENKPELTKYDNKESPKEYLEGKRFAFIKGVPKMLGPLFDYKQYGESGQWISSLLPHTASIVDDLCVIRSMTTDQFNHAPAQLFLHTGQPRLGYASMGSWVTYGIGSENEDLPGFVVMVSGGKTPSAGKSLWGSGFLPSVYQGVQCRTQGDPILYLTDPRGIDRQLRRSMLDAARGLNEEAYRSHGDAETMARVSQYELAYRMQMAVPEAVDIASEPQHVLDLYGAKPGFVSAAETADDPRQAYMGDDATFANNCLMARRLVERGVRFVQLYDWGWDHHGTSPGESVDQTLPIKCQQIDRAVAGLVTDLKQRGMLDETLVVWGGEFGRTPMMQNDVNTERKAGYIGRDHHQHGFTMWMAGGGVKPGLAYGSTDDIGYYVAENPVSVRDLQATVLHLMGIDPFRLHVAHQGLNERLIGPSNEARVVKEIIA